MSVSALGERPWMNNEDFGWLKILVSRGSNSIMISWVTMPSERNPSSLLRPMWPDQSKVLLPCGWKIMKRDATEGGEQMKGGDCMEAKRGRMVDLCWPPATLKDKWSRWTIFSTRLLIHYSSLLDNNKWMAAVENMCFSKSVNMTPTV